MHLNSKCGSVLEYRHLGQSGLEVSEIGLGANSFGEPGRRDRPESEAIVHAAIDQGINFIDTSNVYAQGLSEEYIGHALKGRRDEMLIGTKFGSMRRQGPNNFGGSRIFVMRSVEDSLKRLQTDYIDVYMIHRPDTRMPIEETLRALDDLVRAGKVRYTAGCNFEAWRLVNAEWTNRKNGYVSLTSSQFAYSMMTRAAEAEMIAAEAQAAQEQALENEMSCLAQRQALAQMQPPVTAALKALSAAAAAAVAAVAAVPRIALGEG